MAAQGLKFSYLRLNRLKTGVGTGGLYCATPSSAGAGTEAKLVITFPTGYTLDSTTAHWVLDTANLPVTGGVDTPSGITTIAGWPNTASATVSVAGQDVTINFDPSTTGAGDLSSVVTLYCFNFSDNTNPEGGASAAPVLNPGANPDLVGTAKTETTASAVIDSTDFALVSMPNDQILVSATVPPAFNFTLDNGSGGTSDTFGTMSVGAAGHVNTSGGVTGTVTTNAKSGWIAWVKDTDRNPSAQGLRSSTALYTIPTPGTVDGATSALSGGPGGTDAYALDAEIVTDASGGCTVNIAGEYNGDATHGGTFSRFFQPVAACTGGTPGTANGDQFSLTELAAITGGTPAATDYTDTLTVVAAGNF